MSDRTDSNDSDRTETETRRLVVAITDFLRDQLTVRTDLAPEDKDCLEIAIQSLEIAYNLEGRGYVQYRFSRPLMDIFNQVTNPVSVKDKLRADAHKEEGNSYMRRSMFDEAETEYTSAIELDKWNAIYYCNRANARIEQRKYFEAITDCRQALLLNPDYAKAHSRMGQAYALLHRPREASRCFRQALELEPENERYRHNLTVAESQINRADPAQLITNLLASLFGLGRPNSEDESSRALPTSFMIITESHPPIPGTSPSTGETPQNADDSQISQTTPTANTQASESTPAANNGIQGISFPRPYGVIDEGSEEQPILEFELPSENEPENPQNSSQEFVIDIPLASLNCPCPTWSSQDEKNSENANTVEKSAEKLQNNVKDDSSEAKSSDQRKAHAETSVSEKSDGETEKECDESSPTAPHSEKKGTQASVGVAEEKATNTKEEEVREEKTAIGSSNTNSVEQQNKSKESTMIGNGISSEEKENSSKNKISEPKPNILNTDGEMMTKSKDGNRQNEFAFQKKKSPKQNNVNTTTAQNKESDEEELSDTDFTEDVD